MTHIQRINDNTGDLVELVYYCSDFCNSEHNPNYAGWDGCHEHDSDEVCGNCGETIKGSASSIENYKWTGHLDGTALNIPQECLNEICQNDTNDEIVSKWVDKIDFSQLSEDTVVKELEEFDFRSDDVDYTAMSTNQNRLL